jgi:hypothetical protein
MDDISQIAIGDPTASVDQWGTVDYAQMNKGVTPIFMAIPVKDERATEETGKATYKEFEIVQIRVAGDMNSVAAHPVDDAIKERFAAQYEKWKTSRVARTVDGTPLKEWPLLSPIQIAEFDSLGIYSVEHVAGLSDHLVTKIQDGRVWRSKAEAWLASAKDNAAAAKFGAENERLRESNAELKSEMASLAARLKSLESDGKRASRAA